MQLGMIGLGRMGANLVRRAMRDGHECVVYDPNPDAVKALVGEGATGASSLEELSRKLTTPRAVWVMVPAGEVTDSVDRRAWPRCWRPATSSSTAATPTTVTTFGTRSSLAQQGIHYWTAAPAAACGDCDRGYCLMIGGDADAVDAARTRSSPRWRPGVRVRRPRPRAARATPHRPSRATCIADPAAPGTS